MEELTSKQRAQLRGLANSIDTILIVGKDGIGDNLVKQADDALEARELIKGKVLENSLMSAREPSMSHHFPSAPPENSPSCQEASLAVLPKLMGNVYWT